MKKYLPLTLAAVLMSSQAHAGVATFFLFKNSGDCLGIGAMIAVFGGGGLALAGLITLFFNPLIGAGLIALGPTASPVDVEGSLAQEFTNKYSFLESRDVAQNLARTAVLKAQDATGEYESVAIDGEKIVVEKKIAHFTEAEVRNIVAPADLSESDIQILVADLK